EVVGNGMISPADQSLYRVTDSVEAALEEIQGFYRNYHSMRYVGDRLVLRLRSEPTSGELRRLNDEFADILVGGRVERSGPFPPEVSGDDHLDLPRIALRFDRHCFGRLRSLIDALNRLDSAPERPSYPPTAADDDRLVEQEDAEASHP
ncbi:MAG: hypothetical protein M3N11_03070, partial [Actinomycetota bacterium]|nr:hypothetical protein [Actinomycetota bacterium]